jgi:uncharacterized protein with PhoU and TrkA domain
MDETVREMRIVCMLASRSPDDAEAMAEILRMANSMEEIADAAEDIARVVLKDLGVPGELRDDLRHAEEVMARVKLREGNVLANRTLADAMIPARPACGSSRCAATSTTSSGRPATSCSPTATC